MLIKLLKAGCTIARLNFSQGTHKSHGAAIKNITAAEAAIQKEDPNYKLAIALDTKGPEIRTGVLKEGVKGVELKKGQPVTITTDPKMALETQQGLIYMDYAGLNKVVKNGDRIFVEDGMITLRVEQVLDASRISCISETTKVLKSRKGVNLPGIKTGLPAVTPQDIKDLMFGVQQPRVVMVFASFIRDAAGINKIRSLLAEGQKEFDNKVGRKSGRIIIISKIECQEALDNLDEIIRESDGIMVARGDLSIETPSENVPHHREVIIRKTNLARKPIITATGMLESMIQGPKAGIAEISDIATSVKEGTLCTMLSGETAAGNYPLEAVQTMSRVVKAQKKWNESDRTG